MTKRPFPLRANVLVRTRHLPRRRGSNTVVLGLRQVFVTLVWLSMVLVGPASAANDVILRASVASEGDIWVGQRVILQVDVLGRDGWAQIERIPDFRVSGAYVLGLETQGVRLNEMIEGATYAGQRYEFSIFPQRGGTISVPPSRVDVSVKRWVSQAEEEPQRLNTPSAAFEVKAPPGAENLSGLISTTELAAQQQWTPEVQDSKVGDAVRRTVELSAPDISGMAITPLKHAAIDGVAIYPGKPSVDDQHDRGSLRGRRTEIVTYVFQRQGRVRLPEIVIPWWDLDAKALKQAVLPSLELNIAAVPVAQADANGGRAGERFSATWWVALIAVLAIVGLGIAWRSRQSIRFQLRRWQHLRRETEKAYFHRVIKAIRSGDPKKAMNNLMRWLDRVHSGAGAARLDQFLQNFGDEEACVQTDRLMQSLGSAGAEKWSGQALAARMTEARRRWRQAQRRRRVSRRMLPPLNP